jgi:hypothetical protein
VERHLTVSKGNIRLEENEGHVAVLASVLEEGAAMVFESVEAAAGDGIARNHSVEGEISGTVVDYEVQVGGMGLGNRVYGHAVHARQEIFTKGR